MRKIAVRLLAGVLALWLAQPANAASPPPRAAPVPVPVPVPVPAPVPATPAAAPAPAALPSLVLRGRIIAQDRAPALLVEVDGRLQFFTRGSVVPGPGNTTLRVQEMSNSEVKILISPQNEVLILR